MKHFYFSLLLLGFSFFVSAQDMGGKPVEGLIPIKRTDSAADKTLNSSSEFSTTSEMVPAAATTTPTGTSTEVGITEGQLSVSLSGGATYVIPIAVPPGINGVVPQVSLAYNSQGGNGMAGYGWNISGISTITRIPATKFHDGKIDGVDFNSLDRFAFDGQRLVLKSGTTGVYGADGTVYETESFSTVKITSFGVHPSGANYGPAYFIVQYPDGSKAYYGNSSDSRSITCYAISYWENPQGVRISYNYQNTNNNLSIASINYGSLGAGAGINKIQFYYTARQRPEQVYIGGQSILNDIILKSIAVTGNGVGFRNYFLGHDSSTWLGYQRLVSIKEESGDYTKSYNPTVFNYEDTVDTISYAPITTSLSVGNITSSNAATVSGDFDGDGKMDFLLYPTTGTDAKKKYWLFSGINSGVYTNIGWEHTVGKFEDIFAVSWLSWNNKLMPTQGWTVVKTDFSTDTTNFITYSAGISSPIYFQYEKVYQFPKFTYYNDYNCNGNEGPLQRGADTNVIIIPIEPQDPVPVELSVPKSYFSGDFNGDGLTDIVAIEKPITYSYTYGCYGYTTTRYGGGSYFVNLDRRLASNFVNYAGNITSDSNSQFKVADFNGDGKADIYVFNTGKLKVYTLNDSNYFVLLYENTTTDANIVLDKSILLGDYNGDGKTDFIIPKAYGSTSWYKYLSTGISFIKTEEYSTGIYFLQNNGTNTYNYIASDYDKDGKTDLILTASNRNSGNTAGSLKVTCYRNYNGFFSNLYQVVASSPYQSDINLNALPVFLPTGRGIQTKDKPYNPTLEIAFLNTNKIHYFNSNKDNTQDHLLRSITTGDGVKESISYQPLDANSREGYYPVYSGGYAENYPNVDIQLSSSIQVVTKLEKQSAAIYKKQLFSYYGAVSNVEGLGFLGFRATMRTNWHDDATPIISSISKYDVSLRGANTESYTVLGYESASNVYTPSNFISKSVMGYNSSLENNKVFNIKNTSSQQFNGLDNTSNETTTVYDLYNNPTQSTTLVKEGGTTQQTTISNLTYATSTSSPYVIGRPINKTQTVSISGDTMTSEEQYTYNTAGLLTQIKKKGHNTNFITEDNVYDTFGNISKKTITAFGLTPRETNYEYDASGRFLTKSIDIEGLATTFAYNTANGLLNSETNPYGLTTSYTYDSWFKKTKTTDYLEKSVAVSYTRNGIETSVSTIGDDGSASLEVFDDLGRKTKSGTKDINGTFSYVSYLYDIDDRIIKVSEPYFGGSPSQWNETQYDEYGRISQKIAFTGKTTSSSYSGLTTTINDGTKTKIATKNAIGNVVSMTDTPGGTINYTYFANSNLKSSDYGGVITTIEQNGWGKKTKLTDPSAGVYTYSYNDFGEALTETTPNGTTTYTINGVGKLTQKTISGTNTNSTMTYAYDSTTKLLTSSTFVDALENNATTTTGYTYDSSKRLASSIETTPYATFTKQLTYDAFGRLNTETSIASAAGKSSAKTVQHTYKNGQAWQIIDTANSQVLWQTNTVNARGQLTGATMANGNIAVSNTYDSYGLVTQSKQDRLIVSPGNIMTLNTVFDPQRGNLTSRTNSLFNWSESFLYDSLDRLTSFKNTAGVVETQSYDDRGRITQNAVGTYNYSNTAKAYQNTSVTITPEAKTYYTAKPEQNITYNTFKSPYQIEEVGIDKISFTYNDNNGRSTMFYGGLQADKLQRQYRKYYSADGSMEIKHNMATGAIEFVNYIGGDGYTAPIVVKSDGTTQNYLYLQRDYQGSIVAISDATGQVLEKRLFDAWGNVLVQDGAGSTLAGLTILDRGYTGHEHLQSVGLIHMNGRLYDPKLHRFLQPDNYVQEPFNTQNYNRYGYCWNNPLKFSDPSGEWIWIVVGAFIGGVANWVAHGAQFNAKGLTAFGIGAAAGALAGIVGPAAFAYAGGGAAGAGGFVAGAVAGAASATISQTVLTVGNHIAFGDPLMSGKDFIKGIAFGAVLGGAINGGIAKINGKTFWRGTPPRITPQPISIQPVGLKTSTPQEPQTNAKLPSTTQTSTTPTTEANTTSKVTFTKNIDGNGYKVEGLGIVDDGSKSFFDNTQYTDKVLGQMKSGDFHSFPKSVEAFELNGTVSPLKGGDGIYRQMLKIPGEYGNTKGFFEFIKEPNGMINHRLFRPKP